MAANNMLSAAVDPDSEDALFAQEVDQVKAWWRDARWRHTRRPFTAEQIVSKRGSLKIEYASNAQAKKLWRILEHRFQVNSPPSALEKTSPREDREVLMRRRTRMPATRTAASSPPW